MQNWKAGLVTLGCLFISNAASALPGYENNIPHGDVASSPGTCLLCHAESGPPLKSFGEAVKPIKAQPGSGWWAVLKDVDSDGDGQSNKVELGDPCGTWKVGAASPRESAISNPSDANDVTAMPDVPTCEPSDAGTPSVSPDAAKGNVNPPINTTNARPVGDTNVDSGCSTSTSGVGLGCLLLLGLAIIALRIRLT